MSEVTQCDGYPLVVELPSGNDVKLTWGDDHLNVVYRADENDDGMLVPQEVREMSLLEEDQPPEGER